MESAARPANQFSKDLIEHVKEERRFLHDMSNQMLVAQGMANFVLKKIKEKALEGVPDVQRLEKSLKAMDKMVDLIKARRVILHSVCSDKLE